MNRTLHSLELSISFNFRTSKPDFAQSLAFPSKFGTSLQDRENSETGYCGGQNKNNFVIWYYSWPVLCGLHKSILYSFLIAGHTKFNPDWCFGLLMQSLKRHYVSSLFDLMEAVHKSTVTGMNISKL